ncbi:MAG: four helix bundle protein [Pedosphaera sp.]|nr:MAG: four helix bundle protein [Pedosphaera sp.]
MFNFEKLEAWKQALALSKVVYQLTKTFPDDERFGLTSQMRRASVAVASNLAEGSPRSSRQDFARFVEIATGSVFEIVRSQGLGTEATWSDLRDRAAELTRILSGLQRSRLAAKATE